MSIKPFARKLRRDQTDAEKKLWYFLRDQKLSGRKFRRQHPIGSYIVGFCCIEDGLIIELDGGQHWVQRWEDEVRTKLENPHPSPLP